MKNKKYIILLAVICLLSLSANAFSQAADLKIWYTEPGTGWLESMPLGNGRIGAMALGGVASERIILNEATLYSGESPILETLPDITRHIDILTRMIRNGEYAEADDYSTKYVTGPAVPCYQPLGDIVLNFSGKEEYTDYTRELDLTNAIATVKYKSGGTNFTREMFVSHPDNVLIIRLNADKRGQLNFNILMESVHPTSHLSTAARELSFTGQVPGFALRRTFEWVEEWGQQWKYPDVWDKDGNRRTDVDFARDPRTGELMPVVYNGKGVKFETRLQILRCDGRIAANADGLTISNAQEVVIAVAIETSFNGYDKDPVTEGLNPATLNQATLSNLNRRSYNQIVRSHISDYQNLFNRVSLQIPDPHGKTTLPTAARKTDYSLSADPSFAALHFQYGRYLLISASRKGGQPANLQGLWNVDVIPPWGSAYTTNINMQMNYWAAESTNLSECHEPLFSFLKDVSVTGRRVARDMYKLPGWVLHHNSSLWRGAHPVDWYGFISFWQMAGGWLCQHLWQHYMYTKDVEFLRETAYPIMKGAVQFYNSWLVDDGNRRLVTPVSNSPENQFFYIDERGQRKIAGMAMASSMDLAIIRELFQNTIEAQKLLQVDIDFSIVLADKLARLFPYQIGVDNQKGQFLEYFKEFIESPPRHNTSPYYPLYPGNQFTLDKNLEMTQAVKTLMVNRTVARPAGGGWVGAWYAVLWARLSEAQRIPPYMEALIRRTHLNMFSGGGAVFQIDANLGYTAAVAEMLLQSHSGEIKLLPALPDIWRSGGTVTGLRAEGGFEVEMTWKNEKLENATVKSIVANRAKIRYKEKVIELDMRAGETVSLDADLNRLR